MAIFHLRERRIRRIWTTCVAVAVAAALSALYVAGAGAVLGGSPSSFESGDGNMLVTTSGNHDWANVSYSYTDDTVLPADDSFAPGQKQDTTCPEISGHSNPPKDDFVGAAAYSETAASGHSFLYGATIRYAANGNASENVELNKGTAGRCSTDDPSSPYKRVAGDKLIAIDYLNGGTSVEFHVLTWTDTGTCYVGNHTAPCWGDDVVTLTAGNGEGEVNQAPIAATDNPLNDTALDAGQFAEFGIDLTAAGIIPVGTCTAFADATFESRSSGSSFVSTTKDVVSVHRLISNCGEIKVIKHTLPRGLDQAFAFTTTGGLTPSTFSLNDDGLTTTDGTGNTQTWTDVPQGSYTVTESADPTGFAFDSVTCDGGTTSVTGRTATITLAPNDVVTCTYVNKQQTGAIEITKTSSKTDTALEGATFAIKDPSGTEISGSPFTTDANGIVCVDGLTTSGDYTVQETGAPDHYALDDDTVHTVSVTFTNASCSDEEFGGSTIDFTDTALTDLEVKVAAQVEGETQSSISCVDSGGDPITGSPQPPQPEEGVVTYDDPVTLTSTGLAAGTYTCTITIDP